jgi:hypothetical protein
LGTVQAWPSNPLIFSKFMQTVSESRRLFYAAWLDQIKRGQLVVGSTTIARAVSTLWPGRWSRSGAGVP